MLRCEKDDSMGPVLGPGSACGSFDFTVMFEERFCSILPCTVLLVFAYGAMRRRWREPKIVHWPLCLGIKLIGYTALFAFQVALLVLWATHPQSRTKLTIGSSVLELIATPTLVLISTLDHCRAIRPSAVAQTFLFFTLVLEAVRVRTQWLLPENDTIATLFSCAFSLRAFLLGVELLPKTSHATIDLSELSPEDRAGIFERSLMLWVLPLLRKGHRRDLSQGDTFPVDGDIRGERVYRQLDEVLSKCKQTGRHSLTFALVRAFSRQLILITIPRLALVGFTVAQPFLVQTTLNYITHHATQPTIYGYGIILAFGLVYTGVAISNLWYSHLTYRMVTKIHGALITLIYRGMLALRTNTANGPDAQGLMSNDVGRITVTVVGFVSIIPNALQVGVALWALGLQIRAACVTPILIVIGILTMCTNTHTSSRQRRWMRDIQARVGITTDIIASIGGIKVTDPAQKVGEQIHSLREFESHESKGLGKLQVASILTGQMPPIMTPTITLAAYAIARHVSGGRQLGIVQAFTSLSLLSILIGPATELVLTPTNIGSVVKCLDRIQDFLAREKREDFRGWPGSTSPAAGGDLESRPETVIQIDDASFGWKNGNRVLHDISLRVKPRTLTMIVGPLGSGKSTLLKALLSETYKSSGTVEFLLSTDEIAFCDQDPWLLNHSIRENILGVCSYRGDVYDRVIQACQLTEDFAGLPDGDSTAAIGLSRDQKQRIALARAVYSGAQITILDDALKGLDEKNAAKCFDALLRREGLLRDSHRSVIMATNNVHWLPYADQLIVLGADGYITGSGTFQELQSTNPYIANLKAVPVQTIRGQSAPMNARLSKCCEATDEKERFDELASVSSGSVEDVNNNTRGKADAGTLQSYLKPFRSASTLVFLSLVTIQIACKIIHPLWLKFWIEASTVNPDTNIAMWSSVYILLGVATLAFVGLKAWCAPGQDLSLAAVPLPIAFTMASERLSSVISQLALTTTATGYLALFIPLTLTLSFRLWRVYYRVTRQLHFLSLAALSPLYSLVAATAAGLPTIRAGGAHSSWSSQLEAQHLTALDASQRPRYALYALQSWLALVLDLFVAALAVLAVGLAVALRDRVDIGLLSVGLASLVGLGQTLGALVQAWTRLEVALVAVARMRAFEKGTPRQEDKAEDELYRGDGGGRNAVQQAPTWTDGVARVGDFEKKDTTVITITSTASDSRRSSASTTDGVDSSIVPADALSRANITVPHEALILPRRTVWGTLGRFGGDNRSGDGDELQWEVPSLVEPEELVREQSS